MNITRQRFINGEISFDQYYRHILELANIVLSPDTDIVVKAKRCINEHFNDIPLAVWDALALNYQSSLSRALENCGDYWSQSGGVCAMKMAVSDAIKKEKLEMKFSGLGEGQLDLLTKFHTFLEDQRKLVIIERGASDSYNTRYYDVYVIVDNELMRFSTVLAATGLKYSRKRDLIMITGTGFSGTDVIVEHIEHELSIKINKLNIQII